MIFRSLNHQNPKKLECCNLPHVLTLGIAEGSFQDTDPNNALFFSKSLKFTIGLHCLIPLKNGFHLMIISVSKWLITMVIVSPLRIGQCSPSKWHVHGLWMGVIRTTYIHWDHYGMILQANRSPILNGFFELSRDEPTMELQRSSPLLPRQDLGKVHGRSVVFCSTEWFIGLIYNHCQYAYIHIYAIYA